MTSIRSCNTATSIATITVNYRSAPKEAGLTWRGHELPVSLQHCKQSVIIRRIAFKKAANINASSWNRARDSGMQGT